MIPDWTLQQIKQCRELTKLVRKAAALQAADPSHVTELTRRLQQTFLKEAERLVEAEQ
jgi:hypothetical protein